MDRKVTIEVGLRRTGDLGFDKLKADAAAAGKEVDALKAKIATPAGGAGGGGSGGIRPMGGGGMTATLLPGGRIAPGMGGGIGGGMIGPPVGPPPPTWEMMTRDRERTRAIDSRRRETIGRGAGAIGAVAAMTIPSDSAVGSAIGSVGGGVAAGAALGSIIPGVGSAIGAVVGGIGGLVSSIFGLGKASEEAKIKLGEMGDKILGLEATARGVRTSGEVTAADLRRVMRPGDFGTVMSHTSYADRRRSLEYSLAEERAPRVAGVARPVFERGPPGTVGDVVRTRDFLGISYTRPSTPIEREERSRRGASIAVLEAALTRGAEGVTGPTLPKIATGFGDVMSISDKISEAIMSKAGGPDPMERAAGGIERLEVMLGSALAHVAPSTTTS